jgi:ubiquitin carboxyl-terminal hydrolase 1
LVIHVNRSVFDEYTGDQSKNLAEVAYPKILSLGPWCLGATSDAKDQEEWRMDPSKSMIGSPSTDPRLQYTLRAAVTHYGRHENGHYICYREHAEHVQTPESDTSSNNSPSNWWRLSDDDVSAVSEEHVLGQGGVFMLFYERVNPSAPEDAVKTVQEASDEDFTNNTTVETLRADHCEQPETAEQTHMSVARDNVQSSPEAEVCEEPVPQAEIRKVSTPPKMRTAGNKTKRRKSGFSPTLQQVAAT